MVQPFDLVPSAPRAAADDAESPRLVRQAVALALDEAEGHPARARRLLLAQATQDLTLLRALTEPFLLGIAAAVIQQGVQERSHRASLLTAQGDLPDALLDQVLSRMAASASPAAGPSPAPVAAPAPAPTVPAMGVGPIASAQSKAPAQPEAVVSPSPRNAAPQRQAAQGTPAQTAADQAAKAAEKRRRAMEILGGKSLGTMAGTTPPPPGARRSVGGVGALGVDPSLEPPPPPKSSDRQADTMRALAQAYKKRRIG